jgi:exonuclease SbcD
MKILHTSDWHLGHRLHEQSQFEEQSLFLSWLLEYIHNNDIAVLLLAGDVFDTGVPSAQAQKQYYDFLIQLTRTNCKAVIITGGNHDAPSTINAPKELLQSLSIHVVGKATEEIEHEVFKLLIEGEEVIVAAVPYLRDQDIRRAIAAESGEQINNRYKTALVNHYTAVAEYCESINPNLVPVIAMGHLFAIGGKTSESEQTIYVGNLGDISFDDFPSTFDYVALGHLHRPQKIGESGRVRYSGSPCILSFSELGYDKKVVVLETKVGKIAEITEVVVPAFRRIVRVNGDLGNCIESLQSIDKEESVLKPWVEVVVDNESKVGFAYFEITKVAEGLNLEVLKVSLKNERKITGLESLVENARHIKEFSPLEVFQMKCKEQDFDLETRPEIVDAFHEILQMTREEE